MAARALLCWVLYWHRRCGHGLVVFSGIASQPRRWRAAQGVRRAAHLVVGAQSVRQAGATGLCALLLAVSRALRARTGSRARATAAVCAEAWPAVGAGLPSMRLIMGTMVGVMGMKWVRKWIGRVNLGDQAACAGLQQLARRRRRATCR